MPKKVTPCQKCPIPNVNTLQEPSLDLTIPIHCRTIPYLNTLNRTKTHLNTLSRTHPDCAQKPVGSQSESITKKPWSANRNRVIRHPSRQPIIIEFYLTRTKYYFTRELSTRVEDTSRLLSARYSLSYYMGSSTLLPDELTILLLIPNILASGENHYI